MIILKICKTDYSVIQIPEANTQKKANDWVVKYTESFETRAAAMKRELEIKKKKSRKYIERLISSVG